MKFREHRGGYEDSLKTTVEVNNKDSLCLLLQNIFNTRIKPQDISINYYALDQRGWGDTFTVVLRNVGVVGYLDANLIEDT